MDEMRLAVTGAAILAATWIHWLLQRERNLKRLTDREKLGWVELFADHRVAGGVVPVILVLGGMAAVVWYPAWQGWATVTVVCALLVFVLLWQYQLVRRLTGLGFSREFIRRIIIVLCVNQGGLLTGLALIAYAAAAKRL
jgi:hypothetical protein